MHVEFIGLPGAGKTTIRKTLLDRLSESGDERFVSAEEAFYRACRRHLDRPLRFPSYLMPGPLARRYLEKLVDRSLMQFDAQNEFLAAYGRALVPFLASEVCARMSIPDKKRVLSSFLTTGAMSRWQKRMRCTRISTASRAPRWWSLCLPAWEHAGRECENGREA